MKTSKEAPDVQRYTQMPVLPLRDVVVYPHMVISLFLGREKSVAALEMAMRADHQVVLVAQKHSEIDDPIIDDIYAIGTIGTVLQSLRLPDGTVKVLVEGSRRVYIHAFMEVRACFVANVSLWDIPEEEAPALSQELVDAVLNLFKEHVGAHPKMSDDMLSTVLSTTEEPARLLDTICMQLPLKLEDKQQLLEVRGIAERCEYLIKLLETELDVLQMESRIQLRVKQQMERNQREYYLNEQMKAIQKELGELEGGPPNEIEELTEKIEQAGMPKEAYKKAMAELGRFKTMSPMSSEAAVVRNYLDWLIKAPWTAKTDICKDLSAAAKILEHDHYGLEKVKERILEYLAVQQRAVKPKGPILCLVGPPGVGKTSLGQSIARATQRKFIRMSLGGVRDEAEIRGHRRTYIGALPGKIIQNLAKVGVRNPLFLLDEIDKMSMDFRGDPSSALLEVLDPEQNHTFGDHYMDVDFDLSDVMFVATANSLNIPAPLLDRMEVIRLAGYTEAEKYNIAARYLLPKQLENNGLKKRDLQITTEALYDMLRFYTREAGVRHLDREISKICRKVVKEMALNDDILGKKKVITPKRLEPYLGVRRFRYGLAEEHDQVGQVTGLAWTEVGGDLLSIEAALVPGKGKLIQTGQLGNVMQESIQAAMTVVRSRAEQLGIAPDFHQKYDLHIHVPAGATPKDGPSAGIGMCIALISRLTNIPAKASVAMTGEITLRGEVLPIGGLKEKLLAAHRGGITTVIIPEENRKDLREIAPEVLEKITVCPVRWIDQVVDIGLQSAPMPKVLSDVGPASEPDPAILTEKSPDSVHAH